MDGDLPASPAAIGRAAEDRALSELRVAGLQLLARNFRCRLGEIDLVMREGDTLVFVEVRQRRSARFGSASESVTAAKRRRLFAAASLFIARYPRCRTMPMRFDLFAIDGHGPNRPPSVRWLRGIGG